MEQVNPHKDAHDLNRKQWLWKYHKSTMILFRLITLAMLVGSIVTGVMGEMAASWFLGIFSILFYIVAVRMYHNVSLYDKNVDHYERWEKHFGKGK